MREELEQKLYDAFPTFFVGGEELTHYYIPLSCEDGWFDIFYRMCLDIEKAIESSPEDKDFRFTQIKEKFGTLRAYYSGATEESGIDDIIMKAEDWSDSVCELCGMDGKIRDVGHWYKTLCDRHFEKWQQV